MASFFDKFRKKAEDVANGVYRQVNPFDGGKTYSNPQGNQVPQQVQQSIQNAKYGVLANNQPRQNEFLKGIRPTNSNITAVKNIGSGIWNTDKAIYNGGRAAAGAVGNTAQLPFTAGRLGIANITGNKVAANNARASAQADANNNMFWNDTYNKAGNILAGAAAGNYNLNKNKKANEKLNTTLRTAYGNQPVANAQIDAYTSGLNQEDNARFLAGYGLTPTSSKTETFKKTALPIISAGAQTALNAVGAGAGAKVATNALVKQGLRQQLNQVGKQGIGFGTANAGIAAADTLAAGGSNTDALKAGTTGFITGAALPAAGFVGGKVIKAPFTIAKAAKNARENGIGAQIDMEVQILRDINDAKNRAKGAAKQKLAQQVIEQQKKIQGLKSAQRQGGGYNGERNQKAQEALQAAPSKPQTATNQTAPDFEPATLTETQSAPPVPPVPPTGTTGQKAISPGKMKKTQYASDTVPNSEYVSDAAKQKLDSPEYTVNTEKQAVQESGRKYQVKGEEQYLVDVESALDAPNGKISRQDAVDAQSAAAILDAKGDELSLSRAAAIYEKLSEHFTAAGQTIQAAAMMARRSPESLMYHAQKTLQKAGVELSPQLRTELLEQIEKIKTIKPGAKREYEVNVLLDKVQKNVPSELADKITSTWKAGLLTGVKTQTGNFLSNGIFGLLHDLSNPGASIVDAGIGLFTGERTKATTVRGRASGLGEGVGHGRRFFKTGIDERAATIGKYEGGGVNFGNSKGGRLLNTYVNGVFKAMGAADRPAYYSQLRNSLYDQAIADAKTRGINGAERSRYVQEYVNNPPARAAQRAIDEANKAVLNYDTLLSQAMSGISRAISQIPAEGKIGRFAAKLAVGLNAPFVRVPSAFLSRTIDFTALGVPKEVLHQISKGQFDQRALSTAISEATTGTAVLALGVALADSNLLTGPYPTDQKEQQRWKAQGIKPNSVKLGNTYISNNYLGPIGLIFGASKRISEARKNGSSLVGQAGQAVSGVPKDFMNQSFVQGLSNAAQALNDPGRYAANYVNRLVGSTIPTLSNDIATATDSVQREVNTATDAIKSRIPGVRQTLSEAQDVYGNVLKAPTEWYNTLANPFRPSNDVSGTVQKEVERLHNVDPNNTDLQVTPTPVDKNFKLDGTTAPLNTKQIHELQKQVGQSTQSVWDSLMNTPEYKSLSDLEKAQALNNLRLDMTAVVKKQYAATNNLGEFSPGYTGKPTALNARQQAIANGTADIASYARPKAASTVAAKPTTKKTSVKKASTGRKSSGRKGRLVLKDAPKSARVSTYVKVAPVKKATFKKSSRFAKKPVKTA